jgi:ferredoxin
MIVLYFSGTGNSKYVAELFAENKNAECYSIEENLDFETLLNLHETIAFSYPIYFSRVPRILREFVAEYIDLFKNKKLIIFCTQWILSGDGTRAFAALFPPGYVDVIYSEHFFMPNNVNNFLILPIADDRKIEKYKQRTKRKMEIVCRNINNNIIKKRGFNLASRALGLVQASMVKSAERKGRSAVIIDNDCNQCGLCAKICPMKNFQNYTNISPLTKEEIRKIVPLKNCTLCYRCINKCPQKAILVFTPMKITKQYKGI